MSVVQERLEDVLEIVHEAEAAIMDLYTDRDLEPERKSDGTYVTKADLAAHRILSSGLAELFDVPVLSEEGDEEDNLRIVTGDHFLVIDPVDNTNGLRTYRGEFMIGLAEIAEGEPAYGIACAPAEGETYHGGPGFGSFRQDGSGGYRSIRVGDKPTGVVMVGHNYSSSSSTGEFIEEHCPGYRYEHAGSYLKYMRVAEGRADIYPRADQGMLVWDGAPGHAIVTGAGGDVVHLDGSAIDYRSADLRIGDFIARGTAVSLELGQEPGQTGHLEKAQDTV